jgi:hypothetical protein
MLDKLENEQEFALGEFRTGAVVIRIVIDLEAEEGHPTFASDIVHALCTTASTFAIQHLPKEHGGGAL